MPSQTLAAQAGKRSAAPVTCASCHAGIVASFANAPMRHAMEPDGANHEIDAHPDLSVKMGSYTYSVQTSNGHSVYTVTDGTDKLSVPIHWIFGQRTQTWLFQMDGHFYETLVSYFPRDSSLAPTPGDQDIVPHNLKEAMGRKLATWDVQECFKCHASGVSEKLDLSKITLGLECEHCHAGAQQHLLDAAQDNFKTLPPSLKHLNAEKTSDFCGQCHRTFDTVLRNKWHGNAYVRFQPYRLELSRCFIGNDPRISCVACHNPHQPLNQSTAYYDSKCMACHADPKAAASVHLAKTCPVAKSNCAGCHMPKVEIRGNHAQFTDHYIRVVHAGEAYPE
jgi:hypothetical protein